MPNEPRRQAAMPDPGRIVRQTVRDGVGAGLSGAEAASLTLAIVRTIREACMTAILGHNAPAESIVAWLNELSGAAGDAVRVNKQT